MEKSIKHFQDITVRVLEKAQVRLFENPEQFDEFIELIRKGFDNLACKFIQETLKEMDELIRDNSRRKQYWHVEKYLSKQLITSFASLQFKKTLYRKKRQMRNDIFVGWSLKFK